MSLDMEVPPASMLGMESSDPVEHAVRIAAVTSAAVATEMRRDEVEGTVSS